MYRLFWGKIIGGFQYGLRVQVSHMHKSVKGRYPEAQEKYSDCLQKFKSAASAKCCCKFTLCVSVCVRKVLLHLSDITLSWLCVVWGAEQSSVCDMCVCIWVCVYVSAFLGQYTQLSVCRAAFQTSTYVMTSYLKCFSEDDVFMTLPLLGVFLRSKGTGTSSVQSSPALNQTQWHAQVTQPQEHTQTHRHSYIGFKLVWSEAYRKELELSDPTL